jgi:protein arginine N-methyltransferase 1
VPSVPQGGNPVTSTCEVESVVTRNVTEQPATRAEPGAIRELGRYISAAVWRLACRFLLKVADVLKSDSRTKRLYYNLRSARTYSDLYQQERMLADTVRTGTYRDAIVKYVNEGDVVIDLGTGSGILSFFACIKKPRLVYAIDQSEIIEKAKSVAKSNHLDDIVFVRTNSRSFSMHEKADIIIHEQMGHALFDEKMVENIVDLRQRLLRNDGRILPSRFEVFIEPVKIVDQYRVPFIWEQRLNGVDLTPFSKFSYDLDGSYYCKFVEAWHVDYFLCDPVPVMSFDLTSMSVDELPKHLHYVRTITRSGRLDGFCLYFKTIFDDELWFSTSPLDKPTHWHTPLLRVESKEYAGGESIEFDLVPFDIADPNTWTWRYS